MTPSSGAARSVGTAWRHVFSSAVRLLDDPAIGTWAERLVASVCASPLLNAATLPARVQALLGYRAHDATAAGGGVVSLYDNDDLTAALASAKWTRRRR